MHAQQYLMKLQNLNCLITLNLENICLDVQSICCGEIVVLSDEQNHANHFEPDSDLMDSYRYLSDFSYYVSSDGASSLLQ